MQILAAQILLLLQDQPFVCSYIGSISQSNWKRRAIWDRYFFAPGQNSGQHCVELYENSIRNELESTLKEVGGTYLNVISLYFLDRRRKITKYVRIHGVVAKVCLETSRGQLSPLLRRQRQVARNSFCKILHAGNSTAHFLSYLQKHWHAECRYGLPCSPKCRYHTQDYNRVSETKRDASWRTCMPRVWGQGTQLRAKDLCRHMLLSSTCRKNSATLFRCFTGQCWGTTACRRVFLETIGTHCWVLGWGTMLQAGKL
jgi:hypothetical protein